ncbi:MAG: ferredoxin-type protein NapF [Rhodospirillaceae bacterium]|nr:ferredoxin-type protein NapF [Rhodospirillaceae bacterium]
MTTPTAFSHARRAFLRGKTSEPAALRPPWALSETEFIEKCTRCGDCVSACPQHVLINLDGGYPAFDPQRGECTFCGECVTACSAKALLQTQDQKPWHTTAVISSACLAQNGVTCLSCRDACGETAIQFQIAKGGVIPALNADRCNGCGACVSVCPVNAISLT